MKIALFGSTYQNPAQINKIFSILIQNEVEIIVQKKFCNYLLSLDNFSYKIDTTFDCDDFEADMAISIGGDGTFLRAASCIGKKNIPILGINTGHLGFLADIGEKELEATFADIFKGNYRIEYRSRLVLETEHKEFKGSNIALNEIAILKQDTAAMITIHAYINHEYLSSYKADGLIIATPTGSTAYSLSIGGPIMSPGASNFIIAAVAPHSLSDRPLVVENDSIITLNIESRSNSFLISLDGRSATFSTGTELEIRRSEYDLKVIKRYGHTFYGTLREKLMWGVDPRKK